MERTPLIYFLAVCRAGSIAKAGRSLGVTPQAVAKGVKALEQELGYALLDRTAEGSVPTARGMEVLKIGERMERFQSHAFEQMRALSAQEAERSTVHLGIWSNFLQVMPTSLLSDFLQLHPEVSLFVHAYSDVGECEHDICSGKIDLGFGLHTYDEQLLDPLYTHRTQIYAIVNQSHRLADRKTISLADLRGENLIVDRLPEGWQPMCSGNEEDQTYLMESALNAYGFEPRIILPCMNEAPKRAMVLEGGYVAFCMCPRSWLPYGIVSLELSDVSIYGESSFIKARGRSLRPAVQKYLDFILPRFQAQHI